MKNPKNNTISIRNSITVCLGAILLTTQATLAQGDNPFGDEDFFNDPGNAPIDNPYFWVLLFLIGGYIAYKKLQPKTT